MNLNDERCVVISLDDYVRVTKNMPKADQVSKVVKLLEDYLKAVDDRKPVIAAKLGIESKKIDRKACEFHDLVYKTSQRLAELHAS